MEGLRGNLKLSYVLSPKMNVAVLEWGEIGISGFPCSQTYGPFWVLN